MTIKYLIQKEFLQIRRNSFLPKLIIVFPIVIMCVMPWVMNMEVENIRVDIVDNDRSTTSQQLVHRIEASNYFVFNGQKSSYADALQDVEHADADVIVEIPAHYHRDIINGLHPQILLAANAVNGTKGSMGSSYVSQIIADNGSFSSILYLYNKNLNYKKFMIPSLIAILVMLLCGTLPSLNIVGEKETGTIEAINVTPVSKLSFIFAKLIPYWIIAVVVMTLCFILSWVVYDIVPEGNIGLCYLLAMLLAFIFSGFGLVISNYNETMQQAMFVMWFCIMLMLLMSGLFTPVRSMPHWAYLTTYINPMHYFIDAIRTVFVRGGDLSSILPQIGALTIFAGIMDSWAIISYKKNN